MSAAIEHLVRRPAGWSEGPRAHALPRQRGGGPMWACDLNATRSRSSGGFGACVWSRSRPSPLVRASSDAGLATADPSPPAGAASEWSDVMPIPPRLPLHRYASSLAQKLSASGAGADAGAGDPPRARVLLVAAGDQCAAQALRVLAEAVRRGERSLGFSAVVAVALVREDTFGGRVARGEVRASAAAAAQQGVPLPALGRRRRRRIRPENWTAPSDSEWGDDSADDNAEEEEDQEEDQEEDEEEDGESGYGYGALLERRRQRARARAADAPARARRRDPSLRLPPPRVREAARAARAAEEAAAAEGTGGGCGREPSKDDVFCFYVWGLPFKSSSPERGAGQDEVEERSSAPPGPGGLLLASSASTPADALARRVDIAVKRHGAAVVDAAMGPAAVRAARAVALASERRGAVSGGLGMHVAGFAAPAAAAGGEEDVPGRPRPWLRLVRLTVTAVPAAWW